MQRKAIAILVSLMCCTTALAQETAPAPAAPAAPAAEAAPGAAPEMTAEQKAMMEAFQKMGEIRAEHKRLDYFVGDWTVKTTVSMDPSAPPETSESKSTMKWVLGGHYLESHMSGSMMGMPFEGKGMMGFDNLAGDYFATWADSMATGLFVARGAYDEATKTYTYRGETHDPMKPGAKVGVRIVERIVDDNHFVFEYYETHEGKEAKTMTMDYTRASTKA